MVFRSPHIITNMAMTIDGKVSRPEGRWFGLSSREDRLNMDRLRSGCDGLLVGVNTLIMDNPVLATRDEYGEKISGSPTPIIVIRDTLPPVGLHVFHPPTPPPTIFFADHLTGDSVNQLMDVLHDRGSRILIMPRDQMTPGHLCHQMHTMGIERLLLEGGGTINSGFFREDLVDEVFLTITPFLMGGSGPSFTGDSILPNFDLQKWKLESCRIVDQEVFLHYTKERRSTLKPPE